MGTAGRGGAATTQPAATVDDRQAGRPAGHDAASCHARGRMTGLPLPASSCDRLLGASGATPLTGAEAKAASGRIAELPVGDLVKAWRVAMTTRLSAQTPAIQLFDGYFDGLGERDPDRALDFIAALDRDEPDDALFMLLADRKILGQLVLFHLPKAIDPLCELARKSPRLRIALGLSGVPSGI